MRQKTRHAVLLCTILLVCGQWLHGQTTGNRDIVAGVTYISGASVYLNAGRGQSLAAGDTGTVIRGTPTAVRVIIGAVSSSSSVARLLNPADSVAVGDTIAFQKTTEADRPLAGTGAPAMAGGGRGIAPASPGTIHGRVSLQYAGWGDLAGGADNSRASLLLALDAGQLFGSGLRFTMYGRLTSALAQDARLRNPEEKLSVRLFDMTLSYDQPASWIGMTVGRITSRYAGGIGIVDGAQVFARTGPLTFGILAGFQPDYQTSQFNSERPKGLAFLNYAWGPSPYNPGSTTIAYGTQYYQGNLDRDYLYLQNTVGINSKLFVYQSSEVDLHTQEGGQIKQSFRLTNTFVTLNYTPASWLTATAGYDANRPIDLFESMKLLPDSLFQRDLKQGFRGGLFFRLPMGVSLMATGGYRLSTGDQPAGYNGGGGVRVSDIGRTGFSVGGRYQKVRGLYTDGNDVTVELEQSLAGKFFLGLRYDRYSFIDLDGSDPSVITTAGLNLNWLIARSWYLTLTGDRVWNSGQDLYRIFAEFGLHF